MCGGEEKIHTEFLWRSVKKRDRLEGFGRI